MNLPLKQYLLYASLMIVGGVLIYFLIETIQAKNTGFETKTLWNWMELLIIPLVLAIGAFYLNRSERALDRQIADDRAKLEREIATDRQQEAALQSYLDRMADLLLKDKLLTTENEEVRDVARIRTLTVLLGLDSRRKELVLHFLYEANLISTEKTIVNLFNADLSGIDLGGTKLSNVNLSGTHLYHAIFIATKLHGVNLNCAILNDAEMRGADLSNADLSGAYLLDTNLNLANLSNANLSGAKLYGANLNNADLNNANLSGAYMDRAYMPNINLRSANLKGAEVSDDQLAIAKSLEGAIMPDGTKHD